MTRAQDFFLVASEASGDAHGEKLLIELQKQDPHATFFGIGGEKMGQHMPLLFPLDELNVMGFGDVLLALPRLLYRFYQIRRAILQRNPSHLILIDSAELSLQLAKTVRKKGYRGKIIQYIAPTVWAWRKGRIKTMARCLDLLLVILPFEVDCFANTSLRTRYIGHPLLDAIPPPVLGKRPSSLLALFPGSRKKEITRNLPLMLRIAMQLQRQFPHLELALSIAPTLSSERIEKMIQQHAPSLLAQKDKLLSYSTQALFENAHLALATSGTVTLELALHCIPSVVLYKLSWFDYCLAKWVFRLTLPYYCIVNILAKKRLFPEFFDLTLDEKAVADSLRSLLTSPCHYQNAIEQCRTIRTTLQSDSFKSSAEQAACEIFLLESSP